MRISDLAVLVVAVTGASIKVVGDEVMEYAGARLRCTPSGDAQDVYWTFTNPNNADEQVTIFAMDGDSGTGIKPEYAGKWSNPAGTYDIEINKAMRADNGTYTCMVKFPNSEIRSQQTDLIVKVPPSKPELISPKDHKLILGEPGKLQCHSSDGIPRPKFTWEKCENESGKCIRLPSTALSNTRVFGNSTFQLVNDPDTGDLIVQFHQVRQVDEGYYRCIAQNTAGSEESEIIQIETATVSVASVVGIVFGVIFGVAFILVIAFILVKKFKGDDDDDDYDADNDGANDVMIGDHYTDNYDDPYSRHNSSNNRHEHSMVV